MDVAEVKKKKLELEKELFRLITEFEQKTGTAVSEIYLPSPHKCKYVDGSLGFYRMERLTVEVEVLN